MTKASLGSRVLLILTHVSDSPISDGYVSRVISLVQKHHSGLIDKGAVHLFDDKNQSN